MIGVFFGGPSGEHEASIRTAEKICASLARLGLEMIGIYLTRERRLFCLEQSAITPSMFQSDLLTTSHMTEVNIELAYKEIRLISARSTRRALRPIDIVFPLLQGTLGEDGTIQGMCRMFDIPCVGPTVLGAALSQDKVLSKDVLRAHGIRSCAHEVVAARYDLDNIVRALGPGPYVVKPRAEGSSIGVSYTGDASHLRQGISVALRYGAEAVVEEYVQGIEVHCYALGLRSATLISRISGTKAQDKIYSHEQKMRSPLAVRRFLAEDFPEEVNWRVRDMTSTIFRLLAGHGLARVDYFLTDDGELLFNEINSVPTGLGPVTGANPWIDHGLTMDDVIQKLVMDVMLAC